MEEEVQFDEINVCIKCGKVVKWWIHTQGFLCGSCSLSENEDICIVNSDTY